MVRWFLPLWRQVRRARRHALSAPVIVSLTSYPPRFWCLPQTLRCLLCQSVKPDQLILWLAAADRDQLPDEVWAFQRHGVQIEFVEDLKPYKKLIPALQRFGFDVNHVIADDDMYLAPRWLESLLAEDANGAVVCHFSRIWMDSSGQVPTYREWPAMLPGTTSSHGLLIGHGGVWFPPGSLGPEACDYALAEQLCPRQDDIWFSWHALMRGYLIRRTSRPSRRFSWPGADDVALSKQNNPTGGGNDVAVQRMIAHFGIPGAVDRSSVEARCVATAATAIRE
ncbi:MAG: hypothetical protein V4751_00875 [Pseudomonadota bacterium]